MSEKAPKPPPVVSDTANSSRLVDLLNGPARHVHAWGRWIVYRSGARHLGRRGGTAATVGPPARLDARRLLEEFG